MSSVPRGVLRLASILPAATILANSVAADVVAVAGRDPIGIWSVAPVGPIGGTWVDIELASTTLFLVGLALLRSKRIGYWLALGALLAGAVQQAIAGHPIAVLFAAIASATLAFTRARYTVRAGAVPVVVAMLGAGTAAAAVAWVAAGPAIGSAGASPWSAGLFLIARGAFLGAAVAGLAPGVETRAGEAIAAAGVALRSRGRGSLYPYLLEAPVVPFATGDGSGVLGYARAGRTAIALGDPAGAPASADQTLIEWVRHCRRLDWIPAVYQASDELARVLRSRGWFTCRIGGEAIVDPLAFDLGSSRLANVRHTVTRSRKAGLGTACWRPGVDPDPPGPSLDALANLDSEWRRTAGLALGFTVGRFDQARLEGSLLAAAVDQAGTPAAFVLLRPTGADGGWMLDLIRRDRGSAPGAVEACLVAAVEALAVEGVRSVSLGLVPLGGPSTATDATAERLLATAARIIRPAYDVRGLTFFKDKFAPAWVPRYLAVPTWWDVPFALIALLRLHLGLGWPRVVQWLTRSGQQRRRIPRLSEIGDRGAHGERPAG
ncbi:MAG TPA: DUF2156 domain-containing protein [Candidatus Dormibacteraeota bacterium]|nr:DUF2156 domain-containing protein [Candidatus Dormibacteraeota bacterium]